MHLLIYQVGFKPFVRNGRRKGKQEWESLKVALDKMKESKGKYHKQPDEKERKATYSQMAQNMEKHLQQLSQVGTRLIDRETNMSEVDLRTQREETRIDILSSNDREIQMPTSHSGTSSHES